jgi:two-component system sensor histidine kinase RegB
MFLNPSSSFTVNNRTLVAVRWAAVFGQLLAVMLAIFTLGIKLPLIEVGACIALLVFINLFALVTHGRRRLGENAATVYLALDIIQFASLLYFTGGFENPFAMLMIAQVAVAAAVLNLGRMVALSFLSILMATLLSIWNIPLAWPGGEVVITPTYLLGEQIALIFAVAFIASYVWKISYEFRHVQTALYDSQLSLARQRQLAALGAQAAAAAHELGSPLSTIAIIAKDLHKDYANDPELKDDIALLLEQSKRCSEILRDFSTNPEREADPLVTAQTVATLMRDLADHYRHERPTITVEVIEDDGLVPTPTIHSPEVTRSLGNLVQNALQHAHARVTITIRPYGPRTRLIIQDDGDGFAPAVLARIGEPYLTTKSRGAQNMGLGLFIAQTLIESRGGTVRFRNHPKGGAEVMVTMPRDETEKPLSQQEREGPGAQATGG